MLNRIHSQLTFANVVASIALFVALGGGAYAAVSLPRNSVGTAQLKSRAVTRTKIDPRLLALFKGQRGATGPIGATGQSGPAGPRGDTGAQGVPGDRGPSDIIYVQRNTQAWLDLAANTPTAVMSYTFPAGRYLAVAHFVATNFGAPDFVRCNLRVGTTDFPAAASSPGVVANQTNHPVDQMTATAPVAIDSDQTVALRCQHDNTATVYIKIESARMYVIQTGALITQTDTWTP